MSAMDEILPDILAMAIALEIDNDSSSRVLRHSPRFVADGQIAHCEVLLNNQPVSAHLVGVVDISKRGIQIIWPGFLYNETRLRISISSPDSGAAIQFEAMTKWCKFLRGRYHCVGAQSLSTIPVQKLISDETWNKACAEHPELLDPLDGRAAVFTTNDLILKTILFQIQDTKLDVRHITTSGSLYDTLERGYSELAIIDADSEGIEACKAIESCRKSYFTGPIVLLSLNEECAEALSRDELNRSRFIRLPMDHRSIVHAIRDIITENPKCMRNNKPIFSTTPATKNRERTLSEFIELAKTSCEKGQYSLEINELEPVQKIIRSFSASGGSLGYPELTEVANEFLVAADDPEQRHKLDSLFRSVVMVVHRLHPGWPKPEDDE